MAQYQGTLGWDPMCLGVVSLLCIVSVLIISHKKFSWKKKSNGKDSKRKETEEIKNLFKEKKEKEYIFKIGQIAHLMPFVGPIIWSCWSNY
jgi:Tfp pilus assembly protein PilO